MPKEYPKILVCLSAKNDAKYLERCLANFEKIDYPHNKLRFIVMYGKSIDFTLEILKDWFSKHDFPYEIYYEPFMQKPIESSLYIADIYNEFIQFLKDEEYMLTIDSDIATIPPNTIKELLKADKDIVAPYIFTERKKPPYKEWSLKGTSERFFDVYVFRDLSGKKFPPIGFPYPEKKIPIELQSVGTMFLVKRKVFDKGAKWENPSPHLQFCRNARKLGFKVWALPYVHVFHRDVQAEGNEYHMPIEWYVQQGILPISEYEKVKESES